MILFYKKHLYFYQSVSKGDCNAITYKERIQFTKLFCAKKFAANAITNNLYVRPGLCQVLRGLTTQ